MNAIVTVDIPLEEVEEALTAYLEGLFPGVPVIMGLENDEPMPPPQPGFLLVQPLMQDRLNMPVDTFVQGGNIAPTTSSISQGIEVNVQIDAYGRTAGTWASIVSTTFEDAYGFAALAPNCEPLYCNTGRLMPLTNEELQYEKRWCIEAALMYTPTVTVAQQYAEALTLYFKDVNVLFPR